MQVVRNSYNLQFSAGGGVINAITKSGTNDFRGEVFGYYRDQSMTSTNARGDETNDFQQLQYGFSIGGPIVRDKLHWFAGVDAQDREDPSFRYFRGLDPADIPGGNRSPASITTKRSAISVKPTTPWSSWSSSIGRSTTVIC